MSWEPVGFMMFSNLEAFAWCGLCMVIFRFKPMEYVWPILFVVTLMNLQSFLLRNELELSYLVPVINVLFFTLLFVTVVRVPLFGAISMTVVGLISFVLIQTIAAILLFGSVASAQSSTINGYQLQVITALIVGLISWFLYYYGYGFSYDFESSRFRFEKTTVILIMAVFMVVATIVLYSNDLWINIPLFAIALLFFLKYATKKEREY